MVFTFTYSMGKEMTKLAAVMACLFVLAGCSEPKTIEEISKAIFHVENRAGTLVVGVKTGGMDAGHGDMFGAAQVIKNVAKFQTDKGSTDVTALEFQIWVPTRDKYGNGDAERALIVLLPMGELRKVKWDNFTNWDVLNLAKVTDMNRFGRELAAKFCADKDSGNYARTFCIKALLG